MHDRLNIGVVCFPTFGGSGIVATEVAAGMARRGHTVHVVSHAVPRRLDQGCESLRFHQVTTRSYPVFPQPQYALALASTLVSVVDYEGIDVLHIHYAVPHATSAWMARAVLGPRAPALVTTLHGTDVTLVGNDDSYLPITRHAVAASDAVTTPSVFLRDAAWRNLELDPLATPIEVIPNFVDVDRYAPDGEAAAARLAGLWDGDRTVPVIVHVSNFRPVKRVPRVIELLERVRRTTPARLLLIGDGPERARVESRIRKLGLRDHVRLLGQQERFQPLLSAAAAFVLPSETESFGLAALEALSSGVPVVASRVGGLPEVVRHGETGFLADPEDLDGMAAHLVALVSDPERRRQMGRAAREDALKRFREGPMIDRYEALYRRTLADRRHPAFPVD